MRYISKIGSVAVLLCTICMALHAQRVTRIYITSQQADEPPTVGGRTLYSISFENHDNIFSASSFFAGKKKMKLERPIHLRSAAIDTFAVWRKQGKKKFTQDEIGVSVEDLKERVAVRDPGLNFEIDKGFSIKADSFRFCARYRFLVTSVIGGEHLTISLSFEDGSVLHTSLYSSDLFQPDFKIEQYISCYLFFKDALPKAFPYNEHFNRNRFLDTILYYLKTVECEGYYFMEYADGVGLKGMDRRKRVGWNFKDYLTNRPTTP